MDKMGTYDKAQSLDDLIGYYCMRCITGLCECKIAAKDCEKIKSDKDYKRVCEEE